MIRGFWWGMLVFLWLGGVLCLSIVLLCLVVTGRGCLGVWVRWRWVSLWVVWLRVWLLCLLLVGWRSFHWSGCSACGYGPRALWRIPGFQGGIG